MPRKKPEVPKFNTEEEEAKFWETHSPFDYNFKPEKVKAGVPKDRLITIRLDSESKRKLEQLAAYYNMGPSTFARHIIDTAIRRLSQKSQKSLAVEDALELIQNLMPKDLEDKAKLFEEQNPAMVDSIMKNPEAAEALITQATTFLLRVGGLLKDSGFSIEPSSDEPNPA